MRGGERGAVKRIVREFSDFIIFAILTLRFALSTQVLSTKRNFMPGKFGRGKRPPLILVSTADVGPGEYGCGIGACDAQVDSRKKTLSNIKFAHSGREQAPIGSR